MCHGSKVGVPTTSKPLGVLDLPRSARAKYLVRSSQPDEASNARRASTCSVFTQLMLPESRVPRTRTAVQVLLSNAIGDSEAMDEPGSHWLCVDAGAVRPDRSNG